MAWATISFGILPSTAPRCALACPICNVSLLGSKACSQVWTWRPSFAVHASRMRTRRRATPGFALITLLSSSAAAKPSRGVARCRWRWRKAARRCSLTCLWRCAIISTMSWILGKSRLFLDSVRFRVCRVAESSCSPCSRELTYLRALSNGRFPDVEK